MKRRVFLKGSLTLAGLGLTGCPMSSSPGTSVPLTGSRRDPSHQTGHQLRSGDFPLEPVRVERVKGVVLGGGISGLSAGWRWTRAGFRDYKLLELEPSVGGNSRCLEYPASKAPIGAHYLPVPNLEARAVRRLLEEMDLLAEVDGKWQLSSEHLCHSRQERLFYQGKWHEGLTPIEALGEEALEQVARFRAHIKGLAEGRDAQGRKYFALPLHYSSADPRIRALDGVSFADYVRDQGWTDPFLLWYLEYACRDDFGGTLADCSAWAGLHYFASRDGGGLANPDDILVWPEGNNRLVRYLLEQQAGQVQPKALVLQVKNTGDGVEVDYLDTQKNERVRVMAEVAVCCLPTFMRHRIMPNESPQEDFVYQPWLTANLSLNKTPADLEPPGYLAWDNVLFQSDSLGYVVATHQSLNTDPLRPTVWTWYRPFPNGQAAETREDLLAADWSYWSKTILDELEVVHSDIREHCTQLDITILGHGMIRPSVGFIWGESLQKARRPRGAIHFGHGDLSGMSLFEESQFRGVLAAEDALAFVGRGFESFL